MTTCVLCGTEFAVVERHPMVTNDQWCPACWAAIRERMAVAGIPWFVERPLRADDV